MLQAMIFKACFSRTGTCTYFNLLEIKWRHPESTTKHDVISDQVLLHTLAQDHIFEANFYVIRYMEAFTT